MGLRIFVSYSHKDKDFVRRLMAELKRHGYGAWYDVFLPLGFRWQPYLRWKVQHCDVFLAVVTADWIASEWCRKELDWAKGTRGRIIPIWFVQFTTLPDDLANLADWQGVPCFENEPFPQCIEALVEKLALQGVPDERAQEEKTVDGGITGFVALVVIAFFALVLVAILALVFTTMP